MSAFQQIKYGVKFLDSPERDNMEEKVDSRINLSSYYQDSLNNSSVKKKTGLKELKDRFLSDLHPHIRENLQSKKINFRIKRTFTLEDTKLIEEFYAKRPNAKDDAFKLDGFMTNVEADDYLIDEFEKKIEDRKIEKLCADQNSYLKITEKNEISKTLVYVDKFPLLNFRRKIMSYWERFRRICFIIAKHPKFEFLSLVVIVTNSLFILMDDPTTTTNSLADNTENLFLILYSIELGIKLFGFGLYAKKTAFFREFWNILDTIIVGSSIINLVLADVSINLSALRSLRVLRPLKTVSTIKKLKSLIVTIFSSIPYLLDILAILLFAYLIFAIAGLHLFQGVLTKRCVNSETNSMFIPETYCSDDSICSDGFVCLNNFQNPNFGLTNFDNIGYSLLMVFQISTLEGWYVMMQNLRGAFSMLLSSLTVAYFIFVIFIGNFLILNLVLAVIIVKFNETQAMKLEKEVNIVHSKFCLCNNGLNFAHMKLRGYFIEMSNLFGNSNKTFTKKFRYVEQNKYSEMNNNLVFDKNFAFIVNDEVNADKIALPLSYSNQDNNPFETYGDLNNLKQNKDSTAKWAGLLKMSRKFKGNNLVHPMIKESAIKTFKSKVDRLIFQSRVVKTIRHSIKEFGSRNNFSQFKSTGSILQMNKTNTKLGSQEIKDDSILENEDVNNTTSKMLQTPSRSFLKSEFDFEVRGLGQIMEEGKKSRFAPREDRMSKNGVFARASLSNIQNIVESDLNSESSNTVIQPDENFKSEIIYSAKPTPVLMNAAPLKTISKMRLSIHKRKNSFYRATTQNYARGSNRVARQSLKDLNVFGSSLKNSRMTKTISNQQIKRNSHQTEGEILLKMRTDHLQVSLNLCQNFSGLEFLKQRPDILPSENKNKQLDEQALAKLKEVRRNLTMYYDLKLLPNIYHKVKSTDSMMTGLYSRSTNMSSVSNHAYSRKEKKLSTAGLNRKKVKNINITSSFTNLMAIESNSSNKSFFTSAFYIGMKRSIGQYYYAQINQEIIGKQAGYIKSKKDKMVTENKKEDACEVPNQSNNSKHATKNFYQISKFFFKEFQQESFTQTQLEDIEFRNRYHELFYDSIMGRDIQTNSIGVHNSSITDVLETSKMPIDKISNIYTSMNNETVNIWLKGFSGHLTMIRWNAKYFFESKTVENFFTFLVLLNTILLCLDGLLSSSGEKIVSQLMDVITYIFIAEAATKIFAYGVRNYARDAFNIFDFLIVAISIVEMFIQSDGSVLSAIKVVRVLRTFRVLRVTRLLRSLKFMKIIIEVVISSLEQFIYIALLLLLFIVIFSMLGMQLFAGKFIFYQPGEVKRQNFDSFSDAFITLFQLMTTENWNDVLVATYRSDQNFVFSLLFLLSWIFIGNYILLNLFMAILLDGFSNYSVLHKYKDIEDEHAMIDKLVADIRIKEEKEKKELEKKLKPNRVFKRELSQRRNVDNSVETTNVRSINSISKLNESQTQRSQPISMDLSNPDNGSKEEIPENQDQLQNLHHIKQDNDSVSSSDDELENFFYKERANEKRIKMKTDNITCENSLFLLSKTNWLRRNVIRIVTSIYFENGILMMIMLSSIKLIIDTYEDASWNGTMFLTILNYIDTIFNVIFLIEFFCKIIAYGFIFCKNSYLTDSWNLIDFFIVCTSVADMLLEQLDLPFLKILRILRTLRPLRFLSSNQNMRIVVSALIESIGGILNVLIVIFIVWIMFGILGMNLLSTKMGFCNFPDSRSYFDVSYQNCLITGGQWQTWGWNFDNILNSLVTLFILTSGEAWPNIMFTSMDANAPEYGPSLFGNYYIFGFFIAFMLIGSLFLMNLFVGVIFMQFTTEQENEKKKHFRMVTDEQYKWIIMQRMIEKAKPNFDIIVTPKNKFRLFFYKIVVSKYFESFVLFLIVLNIGTMAIIYEGMSDGYQDVLEKINLAFTVIFICEAILKLIAQGFKQYFSVSWNQFDFVIVLSSILDIILTNFMDIRSIRVYPQLARVIKILRVTRLFKLMKSKRMQSFNKIIRTLIFAIPALLNVLLLLFLVYFLFSILGVFIFKDYSVDFQDFGTTLLYLFRLSTGEDWPSEMFAKSQDNPIIGRVFYLLYIFFASFVMINMFVLIVIEQFENFYFNPNNPINSFDDIADEFRKTWILFSYKYQGTKIKNNDIYNFFVCLPIPLGFHVPLRDEKDDVYTENFNLGYFMSNLRFDPNFVRRKIADMNIYEDQSGYISFGQVLHAAMKNAFGYKCLSNANKDTRKQIRKIELQTIAKIFKENQIVRSVTKNQSVNSRKTKNIKTANPFCNILFAQLTFQIWMNYTKKQGKTVTVSSENLDDLVFKNPDYHFNKKIINSAIKKPSFLQLDLAKVNNFMDKN